MFRNCTVSTSSSVDIKVSGNTKQNVFSSAVNYSLPFILHKQYGETYNTLSISGQGDHKMGQE